MGSDFLVLETKFGAIRLRLRPDAAPVTCEHVKSLTNKGVFKDEKEACFYRSDFVIQFGVHGTSKMRPKLSVNETKLSNARGTAAFAHWDVPDCGDTEIFINLRPNKHLDTAYGGFCVFASVEEDDSTSFQVIDAIASAIPKEKKVPLLGVSIQ